MKNFKDITGSPFFMTIVLLLLLTFMYTNNEAFENDESSSDDKLGAASSQPMESPSDSKPTNFLIFLLSHKSLNTSDLLGL